jgi:hypothetical protein
MTTLLVAAAIMNPFLPGLELGAGPLVVREALEEAGWEVEIFSEPLDEPLVFKGMREGREIWYHYDSSERLVEVVYAEAHPPDETRTAAYGEWLDVLKETFGEPAVVEGFHRWETEDYAVDIAAEPFYLRGDFPEPAVVITIARRH